MVWKVITQLTLVVVVLVLANQVRRPSRWLGRPFLWVMNGSHSALTDWGLRNVRIEKTFAILDVGCGGGATLQKLAAMATEGRVYGVDYASESVETSRAKNAALIQAGRVDVRQASVSQLPFADATFDLATAIETHYYWPDLPKDILEVRRVLKPGGVFAVIAESYKGSPADLAQRLAMKLLRASHRSLEEHRNWFVEGGFSDVQVFENRGHGWMCVTGRRPESATNPASTTS